MARAPSIAVPAPPVPRSGDVQTKGRPPVVRAPAARDPRFTGMVQGIGGAVQPVRAHPSGAQKAGEAQAAAKHPDNEGEVQGEANHAAGIEDAPTKPPVPDDFIEALKKRLDKAIPEDKAGAEAFMSGKDPAGGAKQASKAALLQQRDQSAGPMKDASIADPSAAPKPSQPVGEDLPPPAAPPRPGAVPTAGAVPPSLNRRPPSPRALGERADDAMSKGKITPDLLQNGGEPSFTRVLAQRKKAEATAAAAELKLNRAESRLKGRTAAGAAADVAGAFGAVQVSAKTAGVDVRGNQTAAKSQDEQERERVVQDIQAIYTGAEKGVKDTLGELTDEETNRRFDEVHKAASDAGRNHITKILGGSFSEWVSKFFKTEAWDNARLAGLATFQQQLRQGVLQIGVWIQSRLDAARKIVADARQKVTDYVGKLQGKLKQIGTDAQKDINQRFNGLEQEIDEKRDELAESLGNRYHEALAEFEKELNDSQREVASTFDIFSGALTEVVEKVKRLRDMLKSALKKGEETVDLIIKNPKGFLANLGAAVKGGVMGFVGNFPKWMLNGILGWLMGPLAQGGVEVPKDLSGPSLFRTAMSAVGLTWPAIRARIVKFVPEPIVALVEKAAEFVAAFGGGDLMKIFAQIKDQLPDLKSLIIDAIISFLLTKVVQEAAKKLIAVSNPAGGVVEAVHAIINFVSWLYSNAERLVGFVSTVIGAAHNIAMGAIGGAITAIEGALGAILPIVISFFATMAGLGGITGQVIGVIQKAAKAIDKALDNLIRRIVRPLVKRIQRLAKRAKRAATKAKNKVTGAGAKPAKGLGGKRPARPPRSGGKKPGRRGEKGAKPGKEGDKAKDDLEKKRKLTRAAVAAVQKLLAVPDASAESVQPALPALISRFKLKVLTVQSDGKDIEIFASINPNRRVKVAEQNVRPFDLPRTRWDKNKVQEIYIEDKKRAAAAGDNALGAVYTNFARALENRAASLKRDNAKGYEAVADEVEALLAKAKGSRISAGEMKRAGLTLVAAAGQERRKLGLPVARELAAMCDPHGMYKNQEGAFSSVDTGNKDKNGKSIQLSVWGRRHIVSHNDVAEHYKSVFITKTYKRAHELLSQMGVASGKPGPTSFLKGVKAKHFAFFNEVSNLWGGAQGENASKGGELDPMPGQTAQALLKHVRSIAKTYAVPGHPLSITVNSGGQEKVDTNNPRFAKIIKGMVR